MTIAKFLPWCCCCFRKRPWYQKRIAADKMNKEIVEGLGNQMDVIDILRWLRIFKFVSVLSIRKNQAQLIKYFKEYSLQPGMDSKIEDSV